MWQHCQSTVSCKNKLQEWRSNGRIEEGGEMSQLWELLWSRVHCYIFFSPLCISFILEAR